MRYGIFLCNSLIREILRASLSRAEYPETFDHYCFPLAAFFEKRVEYIRGYSNSTKLKKVAGICNCNRTEWSKIQGVIGRVISKQTNAKREADLKLLARLPLNCTTRIPITN